MDKKEEIYEKALELFIGEGYDHTPLSRIAQASHLTKAGLYHYFHSKEELLFFIHEHNLKNDFLPIIDEAESITDPEERIANFLRNYTKKAITKNAAAKVLIHEINKLEPEHRDTIRKTWRRAFDLIYKAIEELEASGKVKGVNKTFATFAAIGMCSWTFYWFDYDRMESGGELADSYVDIFFHGLLTG
jgi:AcrR family transcriptional regulator